MAIVADVDSLDLVVEPHEFTPEDHEAFRRAVEHHRDRETDARLSERAAILLARRQVQVEAGRRSAQTE